MLLRIQHVERRRAGRTAQVREVRPLALALRVKWSVGMIRLHKLLPPMFKHHHHHAPPQLHAGPAQPPVRFDADRFEPSQRDLAPTPLHHGEVPGQISELNTPKNKRIARKSQFNDAVNEAIDAVRAKGIGIDPADRDRITSFDAYHSAVVTELRARGYNAAHDGEELSIGRPGDNFNEQFDISTWQGQVRRFYAAYVEPPVWASPSEG